MTSLLHQFPNNGESGVVSEYRQKLVTWAPRLGFWVFILLANGKNYAPNVSLTRKKRESSVLHCPLLIASCLIASCKKVTS